MDENGLPIIGPGVDYTKVGAIHQKRTLAFINHFISNTVAFLNKFARSCEQRLQKFDDRIQKINASLCILEAKLSSIPSLEPILIPVEVPNANATILENMSAPALGQGIAEPAQPPEAPKSHEVPSKTKAQDPRFSKFFRMVQVGVPIEAVRLKMRGEGLDPAVLDDPHGVMPPSDETSDSESSFSE